MKLHDLRPAEGSRKERTRVGRGIAAGKGKTAGRGTKGQKARSGGGIPAWFEGGQTPLHMRIPKLRGFKNRFRIEYEVVNVGAIAAAAERGAFEAEAPSTAKGKGKAKSDALVTVNQDILRAVGLVRTLDKPLKILGNGELSTPLFVVADAFTASARAKIEAAGGSVNVLEVPTAPLKAIGLDTAPPSADATPANAADAADVADTEADTAATETVDAEATAADADAPTSEADTATSSSDDA
jgi:large subunit ribosomal protein L15